MIVAALVLLTLISASLPAWQLYTKRLTFSKDFFFLLVYAQIVIYLHVAPTFWAATLHTDLQTLYFELQLAAIFLFEIPVLWFYLRAFKRKQVAAPAVTVSRPRQFRLALLAALLCAAFTYVAVSNDIFFMRIGWQEAVDALLKLTFPEFVAYRMFALSGAFLLGVLAFSIVFQKSRRPVLLCLVGSTGTVFFIYEAFNSRLHAVIVICVLLGILVMVGKPRKRLIFASLLLALCGFQIANIARADSEPDFHEGNNFNDWRFRLNGIDLMARITPAAEHDGFAKGEAWKGIATIMVGQVAFGSIVSSEDVADVKSSFLGSPKKYLADQYVNEGEWVDYPSCLLTDLYGNLGLFGFPIGALVVSWASIIVRRAFTEATSPRLIVIALYVLFHLLLFEQEAAIFVSSLVNALPVLALVLVMNPMVKSPAR